jgi:hypothetical protein
MMNDELWNADGELERLGSGFTPQRSSYWQPTTEEEQRTPYF